MRRVCRLLPQYFAFLAVAALYLVGLISPGRSPVFTVEIWSRDPTYAQLYFDIGHGIIGPDSRLVAVPASHCLTEVMPGTAPPCPPYNVVVGLQPGRYFGFRLDTLAPLDLPDGVVYLRQPLLATGESGGPLAFAWSSFSQPQATIIADRFEGGIKAVTHAPTSGTQFFLDRAKDPIDIAGWQASTKAAIVLLILLLAMLVVAVLDRRAAAADASPSSD